MLKRSRTRTASKSQSPIRTNKPKASKTCVFTFGRFQPPTIGHEILINAVVEFAERSKCDHFIFPSMSYTGESWTKSQKSKTQSAFTFESTKKNENPLPYDYKISLLRKLFPYANIQAKPHHVEKWGLFDILDHLEAQGYENIFFLVGSDRVDTFANLMSKQNRNKVMVMSAGQRAAESGVSPSYAPAMSGTKMRLAAVRGDIDALRKGLPATASLDDVTDLTSVLRANLLSNPYNKAKIEIVQTGGMKSGYQLRKDEQPSKKVFDESMDL